MILLHASVQYAMSPRALRTVPASSAAQAIMPLGPTQTCPKRPLGFSCGRGSKGTRKVAQVLDLLQVRVGGPRTSQISPRKASRTQHPAAHSRCSEVVHGPHAADHGILPAATEDHPWFRTDQRITATTQPGCPVLYVPPSIVRSVSPQITFFAMRRVFLQAWRITESAKPGLPAPLLNTKLLTVTRDTC